jgi:hypothetical protein
VLWNALHLLYIQGQCWHNDRLQDLPTLQGNGFTPATLAEEAAEEAAAFNAGDSEASAARLQVDPRSLYGTYEVEMRTTMIRAAADWAGAARRAMRRLRGSGCCPTEAAPQSFKSLLEA